MKSLNWHRCAICSHINAGRRTPDSRCDRSSCRGFTYILCPECQNPLVGRQFRCPKCRNQITWHEGEPLQYDPTVTRSADRRITHLDPVYAKALVVENKKQPHLVIRELSQLDQSLLAALIQFPGTLHLPDVTVLDVRPAQPLPKSRLAGLYLDGLTKISPDALDLLTSLPAELSLCGISHIPKELAELISKRRSPTLLHGVTEIDDDAAEALAESQGVIQLDRLPEDQCPTKLRFRFYCREFKEFQGTIQSISPSSARELRRQSAGNPVDLAGLNELTPTAATELTGTHDLLLDGLPTLDNELASALGEHEGLLSLDGLHTVNAATAEKLIHRPRKISLRGVNNFPIEALAPLKSRRKVTLRLFSLKKLSPKHAAQLSHLPIHIELDSGACLTVDAIREFSSKPARLTIKKPETVAEGVLDFLSQSPCSNIEIETTSELQRSLDAIESYVDSANDLQQVRVANQTIFSDIDTEHVNKFVEYAKKFSGRLRIVLNERVRLDSQAAKRFSHWRCDLTFLSMGQLEDDAVSLLITHPCHMIFDGFEMSDDQARLIASQKELGRLEIPSYLNDLSRQQIEILRHNPRVIIS